MKFKKTTLPNGLRIITVPAKGNPSTTVLVLSGTGSNDESKGENGLSHFLEHMCFKGTPTRKSAFDVSLEIDSLGAENNAFTYYEYTGYYAKGEKRHWKKFLNIVSDIYQNPTLPEEELEKERGVILQEIDMYEDLPQRKVQEAFVRLLFGDTPPGRTILGPKENIRRFTREDFMRYRDKNYVASNTLVVVSGDIPRKDVEAEVRKAFKNISTSKKPARKTVRIEQKKPAFLLEKKKTDQTHMVLGFRAFSAGDKRGAALEVLRGVLGGGMSSRLFQKLREEMGACYYVRSSNNLFSNYGYFAISTGVSRERVEEVEKVLLEECKRLKNELVTEGELKKTKDYIVGNLSMDLETTDSLANFFATEEVAHGKLKTFKEMEKEIRAVTAKDVQKVAKEIFRNDRLNLAVIGQVPNPEKVKKALKI